MSDESLSAEEIIERLGSHWAEIATDFPRQDPQIHASLLAEVVECYQAQENPYDALEKLVDRLDEIRFASIDSDGYIAAALAGWYQYIAYAPGYKYSSSASAVLAAQHMHMLLFDTDTIGKVMEMITPK